MRITNLDWRCKPYKFLYSQFLEERERERERERELDVHKKIK